MTRDADLGQATRIASGLLLGLLLSACDAQEQVSLLAREAAPSVGPALGGGRAIAPEDIGNESNVQGGGGAAPAAPPPSAELIDDFADCDSNIIQQSERQGSWYHFATPAVNLIDVNYTVGLPPDQNWGTQDCGVYLTGGCPSCESAGLGFQLAPMHLT